MESEAAVRIGAAGGAIRLSAWRLPLAVLGGVVIGLSAASLFGLAVLAAGSVGIGVVAASVIGAVIAGSLFSALLGVAREQHIEWVHVVGLGLVVLVVGTLSLVIPILIESAVRSDPQPVGVFRVAFVAASTVMAASCTAIASWIFGVQGWQRRALVVGAITGLTYLVVALTIDPVPGFHVGGGNMAMPRVAALANFVAGLVGGTAAFLLLSVRQQATFDDPRGDLGTRAEA